MDGDVQQVQSHPYASAQLAYKLTARKFKAKYAGEKKKRKGKIDMDLSSMKHMFDAAEPITPESTTYFTNVFTKA